MIPNFWGYPFTNKALPSLMHIIKLLQTRLIETEGNQGVMVGSVCSPICEQEHVLVLFGFFLLRLHMTLVAYMVLVNVAKKSALSLE